MVTHSMWLLLYYDYLVSKTIFYFVTYKNSQFFCLTGIILYVQQLLLPAKNIFMTLLSRQKQIYSFVVDILYVCRAIEIVWHEDFHIFGFSFHRRECLREWTHCHSSKWRQRMSTNDFVWKGTQSTWGIKETVSTILLLNWLGM